MVCRVPLPVNVGAGRFRPSFQVVAWRVAGRICSADGRQRSLASAIAFRRGRVTEVDASVAALRTVLLVLTIWLAAGVAAAVAFGAWMRSRRDRMAERNLEDLAATSCRLAVEAVSLAPDQAPLGYRPARMAGKYLSAAVTSLAEAADELDWDQATRLMEELAETISGHAARLGALRR